MNKVFKRVIIGSIILAWIFSLSIQSFGHGANNTTCLLVLTKKEVQLSVEMSHPMIAILLPEVMNIPDLTYQSVKEKFDKVCQEYIDKKLTFTLNDKPYRMKIKEVEDKLQQKGIPTFSVKLVPEGYDGKKEPRKVKVNWKMFIDEAGSTYTNYMEVARFYEFNNVEKFFKELNTGLLKFDADHLSQFTFAAQNEEWEGSFQSKNAKMLKTLIPVAVGVLVLVPVAWIVIKKYKPKQQKQIVHSKKRKK